MTNTFNSKADKFQWAMVIAMVMGLLFMLLPDVAMAQALNACGEDNVLTKALKNLVGLLNGPIAKSLAVLAVIGFGIAALTGKVEWSRAMIVVLGIGIVFSANTIMNLITVGATCTTVTS